MTEKDQARLMEIINELKVLLPEFDAFMFSEDALIITSYEKIDTMATAMGYEIDLVNEDELADFIDGVEDDGNDDEGGGLLH